MPVRTERCPGSFAACLSSASLVPPPPINTQQPGVATSLLYSGSQFRGHQKSKGNSYDVEVVLQHVTMEDSYLCGYLKIKGLTEEYPTLTTFFAGEIISQKRPFLTRKWDADEDVDRKHWGKFQAFYQYAKSFNSDDFDYEELKNSDFVFMRWKEQFLVPDHTIKDISGASFAGFYYICFQKSTATIEGFYYHRSSEWYQSLNLTHVPEHSAPIYEFRKNTFWQRQHTETDGNLLESIKKSDMEEKRYPVNVRLLGVMHKETSKLYMASVLWSDQNEIIIYRKLEDFKTLHNQLKKKFAPSNYLHKSEKIVPKFKAVWVKRGIQKKRFSRSLLRLKPLEEYCTALLNADPRVSQSLELVQFLLPRPDDLKPEFSQNSIMVMPSEESLGSPGRKISETEVTQPFVTQTYRCIGPYETKDTKNRPFKVEVDEPVDVLIKDKGGWWLVENEAKSLAWFPAPYLEKVEADDEFNDQSDDESVLYVAAKSYKSTNIDELSVEIGTVVEVLQRSDNGWWLVRYNCKTGYIPAMYLQPYIHPRVRMIGARRDSSSSNLTQFQVPLCTSLQTPGHRLSLSQCNLLQVPGDTLHHMNKAKSHSMDVLPVQGALPTIEVQPAEDNRDSSSTSNESLCASSPKDIRRCRTPPPTSLGLNDGIEGQMTSSTSEPNVFKSPDTPKVPPRPQAQEILNRCTTVTRKNATRNQLGVVHCR
ncbi:SH3 and PX domain-containing protein 2A [Trichomycterus rosablanca]|uniref:SH3 and PX domain-containing protein 2A n=1 Tax=Trichomycterus rosablanca TaxID=2290929 RepID=UPI002F352307